MNKKIKKTFSIFIKAFKLYFSNFNKFMKYMTFPVLGQILGLSLVFLFIYFYTQNIPTLVQKFPNLNNFKTLFVTAILLTLPGLVIFVKAFWEYLVAYGAINSMLQNMLKSGKVYDFDAHTELVQRRSLSFVAIWLIFSLFSTLLIIPLLFWIPYAVVMVYLVLTFQVFTFEPEQSPLGCMKKSFTLIKGNFASTFILLALVGAVTYSLIPHIINFVFEITKISEFVSKLILPIVNNLPVDEINLMRAKVSLEALQSIDLAKFFVMTLIFQIVIQYALPIRSILWSLWYKELNSGVFGIVEAKSKRKSSKNPSEKLMEASKKKFATKKIDRNILKRAMEKDED